MSTMSEVQTVDGVASVANPKPAEVVLAAMYERNASRIFAFCRRRLRTPHEAEDALQNTFVGALQALQRGTVPVCETAWLFKIAENACNSIYRAGARRDDRELTDPDTFSRHAGPDRGGDALVGLDAALGSVSENQRKAFVLRELRGFSYAEIAVELGVTVASVETLLYRARRGIARALEGGAGLRGRLRTALDLGSLMAGVKSWLGGASAIKIAAAAAVMAAATVPANDLLTPNSDRPTRVPANAFSNDPAVLPASGQQDAAAGPRTDRSALVRARVSVPTSRSTIGDRRRPSVEHEAPAGSTTNQLPQRPSHSPPPASEVPSAPPGSGLASPPPATAAAPLPTLPDLPATPVETPAVAPPLPPLPPLPETPSLPNAPALPDAGAPSLPNAPALPDAGEALPQVPQLP